MKRTVSTEFAIDDQEAYCREVFDAFIAGAD